MGGSLGISIISGGMVLIRRRLGSNWIPADNFLTRITPERYRDWITLLRDGNQNMIRVWGGGTYEPDVFYDVCDGESIPLLCFLIVFTQTLLELGILVWQDFQFACGVYPAHEAFLESVRKEAEDNVKRLRTHASLALLCGNNEGEFRNFEFYGDQTLIRHW